MIHAPKTLRLRNDLTELNRLTDFVEVFAEEIGLATTMLFELNLVLDELFTNIVSYGYADGAEHEITVRLSLVAGDQRPEVVVEVEDDGQPFDPTAAAIPAFELTLEERSVGGLGIHLVRRLMDVIVYRREHDRNVLSMRKLLADRKE